MSHKKAKYERKKKRERDSPWMDETGYNDDARARFVEQLRQRGLVRTTSAQTQPGASLVFDHARREGQTEGGS